MGQIGDNPNRNNQHQREDQGEANPPKKKLPKNNKQNKWITVGQMMMMQISPNRFNKV